MKIGVNYPIGPEDPVDEIVIRDLRAATDATVLRYNIRPSEYGRKNRAALYAVNVAGFQPLPVLEVPYEAPSADPAALEAWVVWAMREIAPMGERVATVEVGNEPMTRPGGGTPMDPFVYAAYVQALSERALGTFPHLRIAAAMDAMRPGGWADPRWVQWWETVRTRCLFDRAAIHPYRDGAQPPDQSRIAWPTWGWLHRNAWIGRYLFRSVHRRAQEHQWWADEAVERVIVTEVGYSRRVHDDATIARYLTQEFQFYAQRHVDLVCVYAYGGDEWGVMDDQRHPRPQAEAIKTWIARGSQT